MSSFIPFIKTTWVQKTALKKHFLEDIQLNFLPEVQKNQFDENLKNIDRTDWYLFRGREQTPLFLEIASHLVGYVKETTNTDGLNNVSVNWRDCWLCSGTDTGFVRPHSHGCRWGGISFSLYVSMPEDTTSLTFMDVTHKSECHFVDVDVSAGDMLIFPDNAVHMTNDVQKERVVMSGNVIITPVTESLCTV